MDPVAFEGRRLQRLLQGYAKLEHVI